MRIGVMGAGAVGSYFGAKLAAAGEEVLFVARGEHLARIRAEGLSVRSVGGDFKLDVEAVGDPSEGEPCDLVLFAVKAYDTEAGARAMTPLVGPATLLLSLQNGVESEEKLAEVHGRERILGGLCYVGARIDRPGEVIHSAAGRIILGELDGEVSGRAERVAAMLRRAGIPTEVSGDIRVDKWKKFCWNLSFNAISALTRAKVGVMLDVVPCREVVRAVVAETVATANALGVKLSPELPERVLADNEIFREVRTSMLQDVEKGKPIEADALSGALCREAERAGVEVPVNRTLYGLLSCLDEVLRTGG